MSGAGAGGEAPSLKPLPADGGKGSGGAPAAPAGWWWQDRIVRIGAIGTALAVAAAVAGITAGGRGGRNALEAPMIVVAIGLFVAGVVTMGLAYSIAVQRSRRDQIRVAELYLLAGPAIPRAPKRVLLGLWAVQLVAGTLAAVLGARGLADGEHNSAAFCALIPIFGIGINGWWAARHGRFAARRPTSPRKP